MTDDRQRNLTGQLRELLTSAQDIIGRLGDGATPEPEPAWPADCIPQRFVVRSKFKAPGNRCGEVALGVKFPDGSAVVRWLGPGFGESFSRIEDMQHQFKRDGLETIWIDRPIA